MRPIYRLLSSLAAAGVVASPAFAATPDWTQVGQALGKSGAVQSG